MARNAGGPEGSAAEDPAMREEFWSDVKRRRLRRASSNQALEKAGRVADFLEFAELMCQDALDARGVLRLSLPRGAPDARRRGQARRRQVRATSPPGSTRATARPPSATQEPLTFEDVNLAHEELQVRPPRR